MQNIKVLASGPKIDSPENQREPTDVKAVTLMVTPEQAEKLVTGRNEGKLQLVMRNYSDQEDTETKGANKNTLLNGDSVKPDPPPPSAAKPEAPKPAPVKTAPIALKPRPEKPAAPPAPRNSIELIEGVKRREVEMP